MSMEVCNEPEGANITSGLTVETVTEIAHYFDSAVSSLKLIPHCILLYIFEALTPPWFTL